MLEERVLYFDIVNGISGDMTMASLINAGVPSEIFLEEMNKLNLDDEFSIEIDYKNESGIVGTKVNVIAKETHAHRYLVDVFEIIDNSSLKDSIKDRAKKIFMTVAEAEAKVHGTT